MIIKGLKYSRYVDMPREWKIVGKDDSTNDSYAYFGNLNLLVGKNAAGKSRTLTALRELSGFMCGRLLPKDSLYHTQHFDVLLEDNGNKYRYILSFKKKEIFEEILILDGKEILNREKGLICSNNIITKVPESFDPSQLYITQNEGIENVFYPLLVLWGISLRNFLFSDQLEKDKFVDNLESLDLESKDIDIENAGLLIPLFHRGRNTFGKKFTNEILECMNEIGYRITDIDIKKSRGGYRINVEEEGKYMVSQKDMSQGMFRALALFVILISARLGKHSVCILIDDIGEGLDHQRSKAFVDLVIKKTFNTDIQYFMTTNDRYVMNHINLKYWTVVERESSKSILYNIFNSESIFEDFKYTGLNNFDFFTTDFYSQGFGEDEEENEDNQ